MKPSFCALLLLLATAVAPATAQTSTISPTARYAYAANAGWIDFRLDTPDGVRVTDTCLSGYAYAANFGFLSFGNGAPTNGHTYSQNTAADSGVNFSPIGHLTGYAYAANVGWIQFEQTYGQPRINLLTGQFTGHAYSANLGWIALDTGFSDLLTTTIHRPDTDGDGMSDFWERLHFNNLPTATASTDSDGDGSSDAAEYTAGTDPRDPTSRLRILTHLYNSSQTQANFTFTTVPTRLYRMEYDADLLGLWTNSALGLITPTGSVTAAALTDLSPAPRRYFRARAFQPLP